MGTTNIDSVIAVMPVTSQAQAVAWYASLFGRDADVVPMDDVAEWQLAEGAWVQVSADPERAGGTTVVINVIDLDVQRVACENANVTLGETVEYPEVIRMAEAIDPDGNKVAFVQDISGG